MKHTNLIRLLAVLLCAMLLLVACSSAEEVLPEDSQQNETPAPDTEGNGDAPSAPDAVEPVLKNFFTFTGVKSWKTLSTVERLEGEEVVSNQKAVVLRDAKVDTMNQVTETFTVFNAEKGEAVLTLTNTYKYGLNYSTFDWDDIETSLHYGWINSVCIQDPDEIYPEHVMTVDLVTYYGQVVMVEAKRATLTPINEDEDDTDVDRYDVQFAYEYYDLAGTKLAESVKKESPDLIWSSGSNITIALADANVIFDTATGLATAVYKADGTVMNFAYDQENETYGYYLREYQESAQYTGRYFIEVFNKADNTCVLRYYVDSCDEYTASVLENGNILLQTVNEVEEWMEYDVFYDGSYVKMDSFILDVTTGKTTELPLDYVLMGVVSRQSMIDTGLQEKFGIHLTENADNLGVGMKINEQKSIDRYGNMSILILNNDGNVMFEMAPIVPEHNMDCNFYYGLHLGFSILPNGDYLVDLHTDVTDAYRAIVTQDGTVRAYLTSETMIVGDYVVLDDGIYDYDLKKLYDFEENNVKFERAVGDRILVSVLPDPGADPVYGTVYSEIYVEEGKFLMREAFDGENVTIKGSSEDYIVVYDEDTGKYVLYNAELAHLLTTRYQMEVMTCEDRYLVTTQIYDSQGTHTVFYTVGE